MSASWWYCNRMLGPGPIQRRIKRGFIANPGALLTAGDLVLGGLGIEVTMEDGLGRFADRRHAGVEGRHHDQHIIKDAEVIRRRPGNPDMRYPVDVIPTIDGDTFEARMHVLPGRDPLRLSVCAALTRASARLFISIRARNSRGSIV